MDTKESKTLLELELAEAALQESIDAAADSRPDWNDVSADTAH